MKRLWQVENIMQRHWVVIRHWSDVDWRRYRQEYINECSNYLSDPPRSNHPVIMLTNGRSHVIFVIWFDLCRSPCRSLLFCIPQMVTVARLLCWSAPGVGGVAGGLNTWRWCWWWWWFVSVLGGGGGADCWTGRRDDTDMDNRPAGEVRLGGGSDEVWRESCVITCIYRNSPWTCIGEPLYSNKPAITRYYVFLLSYLPSESLLHFRNMHFRWQNPFRKVFLTIRKMVRNIFLPVRMTISGTRISVPLSPQVLRHAGSTPHVRVSNPVG